MRVDPRFNVEVTHVNNTPVKAPPPAPEPPVAPQPQMRPDVARLTRGVKGTLPWSKTNLTRPLDPSRSHEGQPLDPDQLKLSENWRKARDKMRVDPDAKLVEETGHELETFLKELESRGLQKHPQYQQLSKLRDSLKRIAEREAKREEAKRKDPEGDQRLGEAVEDLWEKILVQLLGPGAAKQKVQERFQQAQQLSRQGKKDEAIRQFKRVLTAEPDHLDAHAKLGRLLLDTERYGEAEQHLQHAASYRPRDYDLQLGLGELYYQLGEGELARQSFSQASTLGAKHSDPHAWLGILAYEDAKLPEAAFALEKAVQLDPSNAVARFYLAQVAFQLNDPLRGNFQLQMVKRLQPMADLSRFQGQTSLLSAPSMTSTLQAHRWQPPAT